jgi:hypothetical protein
MFRPKICWKKRMAMESKCNFYEINGVAAASIEPQLSLGSFLVE